jgi:hypothetical protein
MSVAFQANHDGSSTVDQLAALLRSVAENVRSAFASAPRKTQPRESARLRCLGR